MTRFLKNINDLEAFRAAVGKCKDDVILRKNDGSNLLKYFYEHE